jgi:hypothetical protein
MAPPRIRVSTVMLAMAVAALNLSAWRSVYYYGVAQYDDDSAGWDQLLEFVPLGLVPQAAISAAIRRRGPRRAFWVGFLACSSIVLLSRIWYEYDPPVTSNRNPVTGRADDGVYTTPGCAIAPLWVGYWMFLGHYLDTYINWPLGELVFRESKGQDSLLTSVPEQSIGRWLRVIPDCEKVLLLLIPQLVIGWAGGLTTRALVGRWNRPSGSQRLWRT